MIAVAINSIALTVFFAAVAFVMAWFAAGIGEKKKKRKEEKPP